MKKVIVIDARPSFTSDLETRLLLDDDRTIRLESTLNNTTNLHTAVEQFHPDILCVCENVLDTVPTWDYKDVSVYGYAITPEGAALFAAKRIPCLGKLRSTTDLLDALEDDTFVKEEPILPVVPPSFAKEESVLEPVQRSVPVQEDISFRKETASSRGSYDEEVRPATVSPPVCQPVQIPPDNQHNKSAKDDDFYALSVKERLELSRAKGKSPQKTESEEYLPKKKKTQVITVYSAKGGIGKTTISSEVAALLATTSAGRKNYSVCLIDFDIDYGDVCVALDFPTNEINMSVWSEDIKERIHAGADPKTLRYGWEEMHEFFAIHKKTGLYALLAPVSHEDSCSIEGAELSIMLKSIVENGEFDFVICDTGPNMRNSAILALKEADKVLLVVSQDVKAANDNDSFLRTMQEVGFNFSDKLFLVINFIEPSKVTGVSVQEVKEVFIDIKKKQPFPCIAHIKRSGDIFKCGNTGDLVVFNTKSESAKEFRKIVSCLTGKEPEKKTDLFKKIFGGE